MTETVLKLDDKRRHRPKTGMGLFVTDLELCEYLGIPPETARPVFAELDRDRSKGFPPKQKLWGDRRYLPAVKAWFDARCGFKMEPPDRRKP